MKKKIILGVIVLAIVLIIAIPALVHRNDYSVVYLDTGEVYVGKLCRFPSLALKEAYLLQSIQNEDKSTGFQLAPLSEAVWASDRLVLNKDHIIFSGYLNETSKASESLRSVK